ncbi:head decoration protein [Nocardia vulneris]|uniref:head decoration protein n=1 Tax=Nocardia vulneris TaxID=1141657 RepID=UPI00068AFB88|nr:head decoration protein [Nocardia vulneris]
MTSIAVTQTGSYQAENRSWLVPSHGIDPGANPSITLDVSLFTELNVDEVQTVTITGSPTGGTFTLTYSGQTTAGIAFNAAASAVQSALVALSNIGTGDVTVTGSAGGPYTVTFAGALADQNVAQMTASGASLTGGSSPSVNVATATGGTTSHYPNGFIPSGVVLGKVTATGRYGPYDNSASDGREVAAGHLFSSLSVTGLTTVGGALVVHGFVREAKLPTNHGLDANAKTDLKLIHYS